MWVLFALFVIPDCLKCWLEFNRSTLMYQLNINKLLYTKVMLLFRQDIKNQIESHDWLLLPGTFFSSSLVFFCCYILVFHLHHKHEKGQRLLHYLKQTNTSLATWTCMILRNQEFIKIQRFVWKLVFSKRSEICLNALIISCSNVVILLRSRSVFDIYLQVVPLEVVEILVIYCNMK